MSFVAYRKLEGDPLDLADAAGAAETPLACELASFLTALHTFPRSEAVRAGLPDVTSADWLEQQRELARRCERQVMPLLEELEERRARALFADFLAGWDSSREPTLVHADLGPAHILRRGTSISGVIDWSDARLGDPALDFAWLLHGVCERFAGVLLDTYAGTHTDAAFRSRALFYHRLGPWHEVLYGLERGRSDLVASGLAGVRRRLPT